MKARNLNENIVTSIPAAPPVPALLCHRSTAQWLECSNGVREVLSLGAFFIPCDSVWIRATAECSKGTVSSVPAHCKKPHKFYGKIIGNWLPANLPLVLGATVAIA